MIWLILGWVAALGSIVCFILVLIQMFKRDQIALGIISIFCGIVAFVYGWMKSGEWGIRNVMLAWTGCIVLQIVCFSIAGATAGDLQVQTTGY